MDWVLKSVKILSVIYKLRFVHATRTKLGQRSVSDVDLGEAKWFYFGLAGAPASTCPGMTISSTKPSASQAVAEYKS